MKRSLLVLALALLLSLVAGAGVASGAPNEAQDPNELSGPELSGPEVGLLSHSNSPDQPPRDFAVGGGKTAADIINVNAHSGPLGEDAFGHLRAKNNPGAPEFVLYGDVTCLRVVGNQAVLGGRITRFEAPGFPGFPNPALFKGFLQFVEDNEATGLPDKISFQVPLINPPASCPPPNPALNAFPLTQGNINVHDGQPG